VEITKDTKVSEILREYGDIAEVMEVSGVKRVGGYGVRKFLTRALTVERAAKVHRVPLDEFLVTLRTAVGQIAHSVVTPQGALQCLMLEEPDVVGRLGRA
jgi:hypothetical protein